MKSFVKMLSQQLRIKMNMHPRRKKLAPKSEKLLVEVGYTVGASTHEFTSSQNITKAYIASILLVVHETRTADTKSKKYYVDLLAAKISSGGNKLKE